MDAFYIYLLTFSLCAILLLFVFVYIQRRLGRAIFPKASDLLDEKTEKIQSFGEKVIYSVENAPAFATQFGYFLVHLSAVLVALASRAAEKRAHQVADFVSHKRSFKRKETRSEFLKQVQEHKDSLVIPSVEEDLDK